MKVPNKISNLKELSEWVEKRNPKTLQIGKKSKLLLIREFIKENYFAWTDYRGILIKYD